MVKECIKSYFEQELLSNIAVRVGKKDEILLEYYQSKDGNVDEATLFDMASVTKVTATTLLALLAMEKGLLDLNASVGRYVACPQEKQKMTIRNLLTHTMGIGHKPLNIPGNTYENIADYILSIPSDVEIGSEVQYSCPGFILLGKILEKLYGESLHIAFQKYIAGPLGLKNTAFLPEKGQNFVNSNASDEKIGVVNDYNCQYLGGVAGNAGLFSNIADMTLYAKMLLNYGRPILSEKTFREAMKNHTANLNESRGLGFVYVDEKYFQTGELFLTGSIGHCGHTGQSVFVNHEMGIYAIILSDATISSHKKYGGEHYDEVMHMREAIHNAVKADLKERNLYV